jgi:hypothetical protein
MWRLWTRGWGPRAWWYWFVHEGFPMFVAWRIPHRIALWTFIRVYAKDGQVPGPEYTRVYNAWVSRQSGE